MWHTPILYDENRRVESLRALGILDTPAEERFDRITRMAARLFGVPIALICLVDTHRVWLKSSEGLSLRELARSTSFCNHTIASDRPFLIPDTHADPRFASNPLVTGEPNIRFYAGQPLRAPDGSPIGTLCILDQQARELSDADRATLRDLSIWAERELEINRLQQAFGALAESEQRYRVLVEQMPVITYVAALDGLSSTVYTSPQIEMVLGFSQAEWMADHQLWLKQIHPDDRARVLDELRESHERGQPAPSEYRMLTRDGQVKWFRDVATIVVGDHGWPCFLQGMMFDITERKQAEDALQQSEERYRNLVECAQDVIFTLAPDGRITSLNPAFEASTGWSGEQALGQPYLSLIREQDRPLAAAMVQAALGGTVTDAFELHVRTRAGGSRHSEFTLSPQTRRGQVIGVLGIARDISERRASELALRESEARNRALIEAIPDMMFRLDRDGVYLDFKAERAADLAVPPDTLVGRTIFDALPDELARRIHDMIACTLRSGTVQTLEYQLVLESTPRDFEARFVVCGEHEVLTIVRDITERKKVERMKNEFIATVSHELRTPLTSITGSLGLMAGGAAGPLSDRGRIMVEIAHKNSERLIRLINDILDIEKIEADKMVFRHQQLELGPLVAHAIEVNQAYARRFGVEFKLSDSAPGAWVSTDGDRLIQAITNLLSNAVKFSNAGESVSIALSRQAGGLRIAISDRGPGVPDSFRDRLFQKFAQADSSDTRQRGGTGLGLSITKAIVERLGGTIKYQARPGGGTTFTIDLPEWHGIGTT
jgi:PAS domain S-box-containing protein